MQLLVAWRYYHSISLLSSDGDGGTFCRYSNSFRSLSILWTILDCMGSISIRTAKRTSVCTQHGASYFALRVFQAVGCIKTFAFSIVATKDTNLLFNWANRDSQAQTPALKKSRGGEWPLLEVQTVYYVFSVHDVWLKNVEWSEWKWICGVFNRVRTVDTRGQISCTTQAVQSTIAELERKSVRIGSKTHDEVHQSKIISELMELTDLRRFECTVIAEYSQVECPHQASLRLLLFQRRLALL